MAKEYIKGANPYMPLWEHVPDGEPRVFEYNGEKRVYVYGSHDTLRTQYCGYDQVVWSAPVTDLTDWTCHGVCYEATDKSVLYAPDVVQKGDTFYLYAAEAKGSRIMLASSRNPAGPFTNPVKTELGFDPGILVDDDGRVYAFWGFCKHYCAELNDDMATIKPGTLRQNIIGHCRAQWAPDDGAFSEQDSFFEASSPRKIFGKYVFIYSKRYNVAVPELGVHEDCNGFLSYKYSDSPLEGYKPGGDISFNGGEILRTGDGQGEMTYRWGNNHGSIINVNGQWYVFYHRQTGTDEYARQGMIEPVEIAEDSSGRLFIGRIIRGADGEPLASVPVEMTSQGAHTNGLDARKIISAGYACHLYGGRKGGANGGMGGAYIKPVYEQTDSVSAPVTDITSGLTVGFRYLQFGECAAKSVSAKIAARAAVCVQVRIDDYRGTIVASAQLQPGEQSLQVPVTVPLTGKHAVYFEFLSESDGIIAEFDSFTFD